MNYGHGPQEMDTAQDLVVQAGRRADPPIHDAYDMFVCTELIEETGRPIGPIFGMYGYFVFARLSFGKKFTHLTEL